jgi:uncharacterized protein (DUF2267 family)
MKYNEFVGQVQNRARLGTEEAAVSAIRATLETLGDRLVLDEAQHLAAQLPQEIGYYLRQSDRMERFSLDEFFERVCEREKVDMPDATHHARVVMEVLTEAVDETQMKQVRNQLPNEFNPLFSGSTGNMVT